LISCKESRLAAFLPGPDRRRAGGLIGAGVEAGVAASAEVVSESIDLAVLLHQLNFRQGEIPMRTNAIVAAVATLMISIWLNFLAYIENNRAQLDFSKLKL
jgi:hypothetical protein